MVAAASPRADDYCCRDRRAVADLARRWRRLAGGIAALLGVVGVAVAVVTCRACGRRLVVYTCQAGMKETRWRRYGCTHPVLNMYCICVKNHSAERANQLGRRV